MQRIQVVQIAGQTKWFARSSGEICARATWVISPVFIPQTCTTQCYTPEPVQCSEVQRVGMADK